MFGCRNDAWGCGETANSVIGLKAVICSSGWIRLETQEGWVRGKPSGETGLTTGRGPPCHPFRRPCGPAAGVPEGMRVNGLNEAPQHSPFKDAHFSHCEKSACPPLARWQGLPRLKEKRALGPFHSDQWQARISGAGWAVRRRPRFLFSCADPGGMRPSPQTSTLKPAGGHGKRCRIGERCRSATAGRRRSRAGLRGRVLLPLARIIPTARSCWQMVWRRPCLHLNRIFSGASGIPAGSMVSRSAAQEVRRLVVSSKRPSLRIEAAPGGHRTHGDIN